MSFLTRYTLLVFFLFSTSLQLFSEEKDTSYETMRINKIEVSFGKAEDKEQEEAVIARMKTRVGNYFSQNDFDEDLKVLSQEYDRVEPALEVEDDKLNIHLNLRPKPVIHSFIFVGNKGVTADKLKKELGIGTGSVFDRAQFNKAFHKLKNYYIKQGFFEAELDYKIRHNKDGKVDIEINVNEGRSGVIKKIEFKGVSKKEREEIQELIYTKEYSLFTSWMTNEGTLREDVLRQDELQVLNFLHNKGYADAKVKAVVEKAKEKDRIKVVFICKKGEKYFINNVAFSGNKLFSKDDVIRILALKPGDVYSPEAVRKATQALTDAYGRKGYIDALITADPKLVSGKKEYNIDFTIEEGNRFRVGLIKVFGNTRTDASVILHETLLVPGEIFDTEFLNKTEERLKNIGYFENVNVYAVRSKQEATEGHVNFRDVHIDVEEKASTGSFRAGASYSRDEGIVGSIGLAENNFKLRGLPFLFTRGMRAIRGGGEYIGAEVRVGSKQLSYNFGWSKPYFLDTPWTVGLDLQKMRNSYASQDYTVKAYSGEVFGRYPINAFLNLGVNYRLRHSFIDLKLHHVRDKKLKREVRNGGLISSVGTQAYYNSTNHPSLPRQGLKSQVSADYAGLGGDHKFFRFGYLNTLFVEAYSKGLFIFKGNAQFIKTLGHTHPDHIPLDERLYTGGEHTVRGYHFNRVGPKFLDKQRTVRGGMSEILLSAEYDQYLFKKLDAFVFFDAGNVYFKEFKVGGLKGSFGFGMRLKVFEGAPPVTLGWGFPIRPEHKRDVKHFFISFGTSF